jgi:hypothetical protein
MVPIMSLWMPILISGVVVFVASAVLHMLLPIHRNDFRKLPKEDEVMAALRGFDIPPGDYGVPRPESMAAMKEPAFIAKMRKGPVIFMTVLPAGPPSTGASLIQWALYCVVVSIMAAYVAGRAVGPEADALQVCRFAGTAAFLAYALALPAQSIWLKRSWTTTLKSMFDGLVYGLLTGATFGWLWPRS